MVHIHILLFLMPLICQSNVIERASVSKPTEFDMLNDDGSAAQGYSLLQTDVVRQRLRVQRGDYAPLLHSHLPIQMRARKGQVCRVEVEEYQPLLSMVGHLEPKKFDCSFSDGEVVYYHTGNPLTDHDHVQVTIFFFRNNNSVVQTVDIMVDVVDGSTSQIQPLANISTKTGAKEKQASWQRLKSVERVQVLDALNVTSLKSTSASISSDVMRLFYDPLVEECRLSYTSSEFGTHAIQNGYNRHQEPIANTGTSQSPRLGLPLAAGAAAGGVHRWPIFGQLVAFNRSTVNSFDHDCQEALLQGYRYMHRKANSPGIDYVPLQVTIWNRSDDDGTRKRVLRRGVFLKVAIMNSQGLKKPVARTFRQVNVTHIGGSLSVLPRDSISVPHEAVPGLDTLDVNMTRMQGPLQAQIVSLRDPTRPVTSFRLADLRRGLVALQLLNYAETLVKVFVITLTVVDPFFQVSEPVDLRIATFLQPVVHFGITSPPLSRTPSFQVFSLPLFTYTGAVSLVQKHNIQVVGYIDESMVIYKVQSGHTNMVPFGSEDLAKPRRGSLRMDGDTVGDLIFGPPHIAVSRVSYVHPGGYEPTVERVPLSVSVPGLSSLIRKKRGLTDATFGRFPLHNVHSANGGIARESIKLSSTSNRRTGRRRGGGGLRKKKRGRRRRRRSQKITPEMQLELSIRIVRLYDKVADGVLMSGATIHLPTTHHLCFATEDLLSPEAISAVRVDLINLKFIVKVAPSQGVLVRRTGIDRLIQYRSIQQLISVGTGYSNKSGLSLNAAAELAYTEEQQILERSQLSQFTLEELESSQVCYVNQRRDRTTDLIGLKQLGRYDFPTVYTNLEIEPVPSYLLSERMDPNVILRVRETAAYVVISPLHLSYLLQTPIIMTEITQSNHTGQSVSDQIVYELITPPRMVGLATFMVAGLPATHEAGRLVSLRAATASAHVGDTKLQSGLSTISLRAAQAPCTMRFTQKQVDDGDLVYVPPNADIGINDKTIVVRYTVSGPGGVYLPNRQLRILLVAEDNQTPQLQIIRPLDVQRDGELTLDPKVLLIDDVDTAIDQLDALIELLPNYGELVLLSSDTIQSNGSTRSNLVKGQHLPVLMFQKGLVRYQQSGANVKSDEFTMTISDGIQATKPISIPLTIKPRVLEENKANQMANNSILITENGTMTLKQSDFPSFGPATSVGTIEMDSTSSAPRYFLIVFPTKGHMVLGNQHQVSQFSPADLSKGRLAYRHGPAEIGPKPLFDFARIWDFEAGQTFSLNFTIMPVNSQAPALEAKSSIHVKEGGQALINQYNVYTIDPDTEESEIQLQVVHAPKWGHIGISDPPKSENTTDNTPDKVGKNQTEQPLQPTLNFTMQALRDGRVYYVNSRHSDGKESLEDVFSVRAYDGFLHSPHTLEVKIAIQPTNDEIPMVHLLRHFSVTLNARRILTPYLFSVSDQDVPRDMLQIQFTQLPQFGELIVFWQHGERYTISKDSAPITESYLGMMNLLYVQNSSMLPKSVLSLDKSPNSLLTSDRFTVSVSDGLHVVEKTAQILIRPPNKQPPELTIISPSSDGLILEGIPWTRLDGKPGGIRIHDPDTTADDLIFTLVEAPKLGVLQRLPRLDAAGGVDLMDLLEDAWDQDEVTINGDEQSIARLSAAGSVGGPKEVRTLRQGDRFTKRQIDTERIHYVYTGSYQEQTVYDSCVIRLSDGDFNTPTLTIQFQIRKTAGRTGAQSIMHQSSSNQLRGPLEYADQSQTDPPSTDLVEIDTEENFVLRQLDPPVIKDPTEEAFEMPILDACIDQYTFLTHRSLDVGLFSQLGTTASSYATLRINFTLHLTPGFNHTHEGRLQPMVCGFFVDAMAPEQVIDRFSTEDALNRRVAFSTRGCKSWIDETLHVLFKVDIVFPPTSIFSVLPIRVTKKCRRLPELVQNKPLLTLPGAHVPLTGQQLQFTDADTSPTHLIYMIMKPNHPEYTQPLGHLTTEGQKKLRYFTQFQLNSGQVLFQTDDIIKPDPEAVQVFELHLFDAGDFEEVAGSRELYQTAEQASDVLQRFGTTEANPYNERMQYVTVMNAEETQHPVLSIKPILLRIQYNPLIVRSQPDEPLTLLVRDPPSSIELETIRSGMMGFRLSAINLFVNRPDANYRVMPGQHGHLFNLWLNQSVNSFTQKDLNQRRLAFILSDESGNRNIGSMSKQPEFRQFRGPSEELQFEISSPRDPHIRLHHSLKFEWMQIGFHRPMFRVCGERGLLRMGIVRHGPSIVLDKHSADVHIGMDPRTALEGQDFSLHSQKLLTFKPGQRRRMVLVRIHPRPQKDEVRRQEFHVILKSPTGAVLAVNKRAKVVIRYSPKCKNRAYFSPLENENLVKRDLDHATLDTLPALFEHRVPDNGAAQKKTETAHSTQLIGQEGNVKQISLNDWLATNELPDSKTLSAAYQSYVKRLSKTPCSVGWKFRKNRCYHSFEQRFISWEGARSNCESYDAFLISIDSPKLLEWMKEQFNIRGSYWIGLHQPQPKATWIWHNLERTSYTTWDEGFPVRARWTRSTGRVTDSPTVNSGWKSKSHKVQWGPRACVLTNRKALWQNRPCNRPMMAGYVCMRNPEVQSE